VKYWEIIIKNLRNAGWNCGSMATTDGKGQPIWVVAAERSDAGRFIVHVDEKLTAFVELQSAICAIKNRRRLDIARPVLLQTRISKGAQPFKVNQIL
jgi:hypothetical protein